MFKLNITHSVTVTTVRGGLCFCHISGPPVCIPNTFSPLHLSTLHPVLTFLPPQASHRPLPIWSLSLLFDTLRVAGELPSVFHLPLSHLSHSLPADPPTQRVLTIQTHGARQCAARPRHYRVSTAGGVPGRHGRCLREQFCSICFLMNNFWSRNKTMIIIRPWWVVHTKSDADVRICACPVLFSSV